jgi:hypothetical protein
MLLCTIHHDQQTLSPTTMHLLTSSKYHDYLFEYNRQSVIRQTFFGDTNQLNNIAVITLAQQRNLATNQHQLLVVLDLDRFDSHHTTSKSALVHLAVRSLFIMQIVSSAIAKAKREKKNELPCQSPRPCQSLKYQYKTLHTINRLVPK